MDIFSSYRQGLTVLLARLGNDHPRLSDALTLQARLLENVEYAQLYGDTETRRAERSQMLDFLNRLALETLGVSFNELCPPSSQDVFNHRWQPSADSTQIVILQSRMLAEHLGRLDSALSASIRGAFEQLGLESQLLTTALPQPDSPPQPPAVYAPREKLVRELRGSLTDVTWLALVDGPGKGKTQLARTMAESSDVNHVWWISLRSPQDGTARAHLERQLVLWLVHLHSDERIWDLYLFGRLHFDQVAQAIVQSVGRDALLVVDNLPDPVQDEATYEALHSLGAMFAATGTKLLTTSQREVPPALQADLDTAFFAAKPPPFSVDDVLDLLRTAGAPGVMTKDTFSGFILGITAGHPSLVAATVQWLRRYGWRLGEQELAELFAGKSLDDTREYTRRRMLRLLDDYPRELLYRLSLLWAEFDRALALKIAGISPSIEHAGECLDELTGPWLERTASGQYEVTLLLRDAGEHNLAEEVRKQVHKTAIEHYLSQHTLDISQVLTVALHLWRAGEIQRFVMFLVEMMLAARTSAEAKQIDWAASVLSPDMEWPSELSLSDKILLRAAQVRTRARAGRDIAVFDADLERLLAQAGSDESSAVIFACATAGPLLNEMPANTAMSRALNAVRLLHETSIIPEDALSGPPEQMLWFPALRLRGLAQIRSFLLEIRQMNDDMRENLFSPNWTMEATSLLIDTTWSAESDKSSDQRNWNGVLECLEVAHEIGTLPGAAMLRVAATRAKAVVLADYLRRPDDALNTLETVPDALESRGSFLLQYTAGCILFDAKRYEEALERLDTATASEGDSFSYYRLDAKRRAAIIQSKLGIWEDAFYRCAEVVHLASHAGSFVYDRLEMMGELAWIHWSLGDKQRAFGAMHGFVFGLVGRDSTEARYREAFNKAGHGLGWFASLAETGQPPSPIEGEDYSPVEAGLFGIRRHRLGSYVPPLGFSEALLLTQLGAMADAVTLSRTAWKIYKWADSLREEQDNKAILAMLMYATISLAPLTARFDHPQEALSTGLQAVQALALANKFREDGVHALDMMQQDVDFKEAWLSLSKEARKSAERKLLYLTFGPAMADLLNAISGEEVTRKLTDWQSTVSDQQEAFEDPEFWHTIMRTFSRIFSPHADEPLREEDLDICQNEPVLKVLWYLVSSRQPKTNLAKSLQMQVVTVDFLIKQADLGMHMLPAVGKFVHRFWLYIAETRRFALNSPQVFHEELLKIPVEQGVRTAIRVLKAASRAIGVALPEEIRTRFNEAKESGTW